MRKLMKTLAVKAFAWVTGKFLGEVAVSAVVTLVMAGLFSSATSKPEKAVAAPHLALFAASGTIDPEVNWLDLPLDRDPTGSLAQISETRGKPRHGSETPKLDAAEADVPLPPRRPVFLDANLPAAVARQHPVQVQVATAPLLGLRESTCASEGDEAPCPPALVPGPRPDADIGYAPAAPIVRGEAAGWFPAWQRRRWLFGMAADLVPTPRRMVAGVSSVGQTIAGLTDNLR